MHTKQEILEEIKRTAKENSGVPLGQEKFAKETGIKNYHWGKYWPRFGDAQRAAGFAPNVLKAAYPDKFLFEKFISLTRELGHFPTVMELRLKNHNDPNFPSHGAWDRLGNKRERAKKIFEYATQKGLDDIIKLCRLIIEDSQGEKAVDEFDENQPVGEVYLFKSGRYYKIGKTNDTVRRGTELRIQLPEKLDLIHSIKTDDPSGVEAYWHKRFESKRKNGEWFNLGSADIKTFKHWRRIC